MLTALNREDVEYFCIAAESSIGQCYLQRKAECYLYLCLWFQPQREFLLSLFIMPSHLFSPSIFPFSQLIFRNKAL